MRTRDRDQDWIEELGRRRLEALIAELTPPAAEDGPPSAARSEATHAADTPDSAPAPVGIGPFLHRPPREPDRPGEAEPPGHGSRVPASNPAAEVPRGRHARRASSPAQRAREWVSDRLPETAREQGLQQGHIGVLALLLAVAVLLGGWAWLRASGDPPAPAAAPVVTAPGAASGSPSSLTSPSPSGSPGAAPGDGAGASEVVVHVAGKVRRPGIVVLRNGSRVIDAVRRAGGFAPGTGARSAALNLARVLVDGEQIVVGGAAPAAGAVPAPGSSAGASAGPAVSLNTADQAALETLPGVGPVTAAAILQWRDEHGPFTAVEQLLEVSGIGEATLAEITPHVTL